MDFLISSFTIFTGNFTAFSHVFMDFYENETDRDGARQAVN
jgi:hypothetical protein